MRIIFIGSSRFGLKCLRALAKIKGCQVVGTVTAPKQFSISYRREGVKNVLYADVSAFSNEHEIPSFTIRNGMRNERLLSNVRKLKPDIFIVVGWYHIVPSCWRSVAPAYGMHASLLPIYSGGAPLVWAMINGEKYAGITLFRLDDGVDSGPIVGQRATEIVDTDTIKSVYDRIEALGVSILQEFVPELRDGKAKHYEQDETKRTTFPQRGPEDGIIDWKSKSRTIFDFIRAQTKPYPGAFTYCNGRVIKIWKCLAVGSEVENADKLENGTVRLSPYGIVVTVCDGRILLLELSVDESEEKIGWEELVKIAGGADRVRFHNSSSLPNGEQ